MIKWLAVVVMALALAVPASATIFLARRADGVYPEDWAPFMRVLLRFEETSGGDDAVDSSGTVTVLDDVGTVARTTTAGEFIEGTKAATFANAKYFNCSDGNCGDTTRLDGDGATRWTFGGGYRPTTSGDLQSLFSKFSSPNGYTMLRETTNKVRCLVGEGGGSAVQVDSATNADSGVYSYPVCVADGANVKIFMNAEADGTTAGTELPANVAADVEVGGGASSIEVVGQLDEWFVDDLDWGLPTICRACSIGIGDGTGDFSTARGMCDVEDTTLYLACNSNADCNPPYGECSNDNGEDNCASTRCCMGRRPACGDCDLPDCNLAGPESPSGEPLTDWTTLPLVVWRFESGTFTNADGTAHANSKTLTNNNTVTADTVQFREGAQSASYLAGSQQYFSCTDANCGGTEPNLDGDSATAWSWGCWFRVTGDVGTSDQTIFAKITGTSSGWSLLRSNVSSGGRVRCRWGEGTTRVMTSVPADQVPSSTWAFGACTTGTQGRLYYNGRTSGAALGTTDVPANNTAMLVVNTSSAAARWTGQTDECFVDDMQYGPETMCRICALGFSGVLGECSGGDQTQYKDCPNGDVDCNGGAGHCEDGKCQGYRVERCSGCELTPCNQTAPGTN